jgi:glycylpeptide N-tetradecanoyltransferase
MENKHKFWNTQPVDISKNSIESKPIQELTIDQIQKDPYTLPKGFEWSIIDLTKEEELNELQVFLATYYNYDDEEPDRILDYSKEFLKWFLMPPNYFPDLIVGVKCNNRLVASICGIPMMLNIYGKIIDTIEINFLCIHPKLRQKRLAPVMIKEVTRRTNLHNIWQAFYTGEKDLPNCLISYNYYHRPLNIPKLVDLDFLECPKKLSLINYSRLFNTIEKTNINIRKLQESDCEMCCEKFNEFHKKFKLSIFFKLDYFKQHFLPLESYVVETNNVITDFISFYSVPLLIKNNKHKEIKKFNVYYYFHTETKLEILMENSLYLLKQKGADLVNCLEQYDNKEFIDKLKFKEGTLDLNFYLYNWTCPNIDKNEMSIIMV